MRSYANYIFDLYGTLLDVRTDENKPALWQFMADFFAVYGCLLGPDALRDAFWRLDARERDALRRQTPDRCTEIRIERVFLRLLLESPARPCAIPLGGRTADHWRLQYARNPASALRALENGDWVAAAANAFRIHSTDWLRPYPDTLPILQELVRRGKRLYLLSNAQGVFTRPEIERTGLAPFFPAPRISSEAGVMKPDRTFLDALLRDENLDPCDTVFIGNEMRSDMAIAVRCGIDGVLLDSANLPAETLRQDARRLLAAESAPPSAMPLVISRLRDLLPSW